MSSLLYKNVNYIYLKLTGAIAESFNKFKIIKY